MRTSVGRLIDFDRNHISETPGTLSVLGRRFVAPSRSLRHRSSRLPPHSKASDQGEELNQDRGERFRCHLISLACEHAVFALREGLGQHCTNVCMKG